MVMDFLGPSLEDFFNFCNRKFSLKTVLMLAGQLISRIEYIHAQSFIHQNVKPGNFLMGHGKRGNQVNMIGFGTAKRYHDSEHIPYCENQHPSGDAQYASINNHRGVGQSRRDDMESLGYMMLYFLRGSLPWQGQNNRIMNLKTTTSIEELCHGCPDEFAAYLNYTRSLSFDDKPDYSYLRGIFSELFARKSFQYDNCFDWTVRKYWSKNVHIGNAKDEIVLQLETPPLSGQRLDDEATRIYEDIAKVEAELRDAISENQRQAVSELCDKLYQQHCDLLALCQLPSASASLRQLPQKHDLPIRLWTAFHSYLELLERGLSGSREHMLSFIYTAYSMMNYLVESAPAFRNFWFECLEELKKRRIDVEERDSNSLAGGIQDHFAVLEYRTSCKIGSGTFSDVYKGK